MVAVSVIIPAYNAAAYIRSTIESVLSQTERDCEIIVVNDGSKDDTETVVKSIPQVIYVHQENAGVSAARNRGVEHAQGEFVAFLDSDDLWHPDKLKRQLAAMRTHPDADFSRTALIDRESPDGWLDEVQMGQPIEKVTSFTPSFLSPYFCPTAVMVRKDAFTKIGGFNTSLRIAEDIDLFLRVLAENPHMVVLHDELAMKRTVVGSLGDDSVAGYVQLLSVYRTFLEERPAIRVKLGQAVIRQAFRQLHVALASSLIRTGAPTQARNELVNAWKLGVGTDILGLWARSLLPAWGKRILKKGIPTSFKP